VNEEVEFWETRYLAGTTPWDFHGVPMALSRWLASGQSPGRALVPGCGSGYELKAFHEVGWHVLGIDYTPAAVARARSKLGAHGNKVLLGEFFTADFGEERFDVIYERTFLCAITPERWPAYVARMRELLVDGGKLIGFFFFGEQSDPPPYPLTREKQDALFAQAFVLETDEEVSDSLPLFAGRERWQVWKKKS
jgi:SAM-dependent methyltransferase